MTPAFIPPRPLGILGFAAGLGLLIGLTGAYVPGEPEPRPNILGNPSMEIDQANEGGSLSLSSGANAFVVDQWSAGFHSASATVSAQRVADAPAGFANSLKLTVATGATVAAGDYLFIRQPIEGYELTNLALGTSSAQQACVSFWAKSSIGSYTLSAALQNYAGTRSYPLNFTVTSANAWTPVAACFTLDTGGAWVTSGTAGGAYLIVAAAAGSTFQGTINAWTGANLYGTSANTNSVLSTNGATFQLTGVKLEAAPGPTPFVRRPFAEELLRCERYYRKSYDLGIALGSATHNGMVGGIDWDGASGYAISLGFAIQCARYRRYRFGTAPEPQTKVRYTGRAARVGRTTLPQRPPSSFRPRACSWCRRSTIRSTSTMPPTRGSTREPLRRGGPKGASLMHMFHPHFSPDITLGHLLQAVVVVVTGGGGILGGFLSLRSDIDLQRAEYRVALAGHEARLAQAEHELDDRRREDRQFQAEMRASLDRVMEAIAGLRTELVQKQNRR